MQQKWTELKGEIESSIVKVGDFFNTILTIVDKITRQKVSKEIEDLKRQ